MSKPPPPTPLPAPGAQPLTNARALEEMAELMEELDTHDSMGLTDSAIDLILRCENETDSAIHAARLEDEMVKSLVQLEINAKPLTPQKP
jgi:hypothetical protein